MILGNKCDMDDKRQVSRERGEAVSAACYVFFVSLIFFACCIFFACLLFSLCLSFH